MKNLTLNIAVLDPNNQNSTYSYQEAVLFRAKILKFAFALNLDLSVNILSCQSHGEVIDALDNQNTIALQPISNSSTGLVPVKVFETMVSKLDNIEFYGGIDLKIENRLVARNEQKDLLSPQNYTEIDIILTNLAPQGQCQNQIDLIKTANPNRELKIINSFASTTAAIEALNSEQYADKNVVAIGNIETAQTLGLSYTSAPWQDYPDNNFTTFLVIGDRDKVDQELRGLLGSFSLVNSETGKIDFIISLPISDDLGSLGEFLHKLKEFGVDLNYIKVDTGNGNVKPYFSGTILVENKDKLRVFIEQKNAILNIAYNHLISQDKINNSQSDITLFDRNNIKIDGVVSDEVEITANVPNYAGALADVLSEIKVLKLNLTSLEVFARGWEPFAVLKGKGVRVN